MLDVALQWIADAQANVVWDALVVAGIFAGSVLFAFTLGRNSIIVSFVAIILAALVTLLLPSFADVPALTDFSEAERDVVTFIVCAVLFGIIFRRNRFFEPYIVPTGLERFVFAGALAGFTVVILGTFFADQLVASAYVDQLFLHPVARMGWLLTPVLILAVFRGENA